MVLREKALKQLGEIKKNAKKIRLATEKWDSDFQVLIAIILSARSRDEKTIPVSEKLFEKYPSAEKLASARLIDVKRKIKQINFYKNKSENIINCSKKIIKDYKGEIPKEINELIKLPGVGRKTANVFLSKIGKNAIGVDTHVSYISRKLRWTKNTKPKLIEDDLKNLFPENFWSKINQILVRFGKTYTKKKEKDQKLEKIKRIK